jgi:hypothetical protein
MRIEKLPAAAPAAAMTPSVSVSPPLVVTYGVANDPAASSKAPATIILIGPYLSASAAKIGWAAPYMNCPIASAKLNATMETPVDSVIGRRNSPVVCRNPIVIIRMAAETEINATTRQRERGELMHGA